MSIGEKIYSLRTQKNLSQEKLAELLHVSRQSVSKWETDASVPELEKLHSICNLFGVTMDEITGREEKSSENDPEMNKLLKMYGSEEDIDSVIQKEEFEKIRNSGNEPITENTAKEEQKKKREKNTKKKVLITAFTAVILVVVITVTAIFGPFLVDNMAVFLGSLGIKKAEHTFVLVHGLGGWGSGTGINAYANYWGGGTDDLVTYLNEQGFKTVAPSVGPLSSAWDRACELYAQLTGTRVDYGAAHSENHNHERFGRAYSTPLVPDWGEKAGLFDKNKINLVGHSFGGATVRLLCSLLEYGSKEEKAATGENTSPLFTGGKGDLVNSVITLCAPHNGSSLATVLDKIGNIANIESSTELLVSLCFSLAGTLDSGAIYDFQLDQFGLTSTSGDKNAFRKAFDAVCSSGNDHAGYDLSPDGANKLNEKIKTVDSVYYFSYSYSTTNETDILGIHAPKLNTLPVLYPFAIAMGSFEGTTKGGIVIDKNWRENDGLVNLISAKYPFSEEWCEYTEEKTEKGVWNVMPVRNGDHGTVIGLNASATDTHAFWVDMFNMIKKL
ncbi:MAG: helix-turn-helix domain-containing protein [Ruminococcaceae bacterium]|nr:helix-turn-helix domain-containing protein [Oscillospiraceae bacterium]